MATYKLTLTDEEGVLLDYWYVALDGSNPDAANLSKGPARADLMNDICEEIEVREGNPA